MTDRLEHRWNHCKAWIGQRIEPEDAGSWLESLQLAEIHPNRVLLSGVPNSFFKHRISTRYRPLILESLRNGFPDISFSGDPELELRIEEIPYAQDPPGNGASGRSTTSPAAGAGPDCGREAAPEEASIAAVPGRWNFSRFFPSPGNESALHFSREAAAQPGKRYNPLLLVGSTGMGKTHLLQAVRRELIATNPSFNAVYCTGEEFRNEVLDAITRRRMKPLRDFYRSVDALLMDDLEFLLISPKAQEELLHTFDSLQRAGKQLVFSADRFPAELDGMLPSLRSRMEMGLMAELSPPDLPTRIRIVESRAGMERIHLPEEVVHLLALRITRNLRKLEGAVVRLAAHAGLYGQPVSIGFAEQYAEPYFDTRGGENVVPISRESILERVADRFGLTLRALKGRSRSQDIVRARQVAIHLLKSLGNCSYAQIGTLLGNRSHSTIVHGHQVILAEVENNPRLMGQILRIAEEFPG